MPTTLPPSTTGISATAPTTESPNTPDGGALPTAASATTTTNKPKYVISPSGHAAHPDEILASCRALRAHVTQLVTQAEKDLADVTERIRVRELAEKRRVAPGWLDSEARLLEPERAAAASSPSPGAGQQGVMGGGGGEGQQQHGEMLLQQPLQGYGGGGGGGGIRYGEGYGDGYGHGPGGASEMAVPDEGEELDRAFGSLQMGRP
jgi:hypothetical protein